MMDSLPTPGWESEQITYQHLIRPVVAFVRDHGPVPVARVCEHIAVEAAGDLNFASPTKNRHDAARRVFNLLVQDIDALTVTDGTASVPLDLTAVNSALFGRREVPSSEELVAAREASRRRRLLREWSTRGLFYGKWNNGIRQYSDAEIEWMADQIRTYGYVGSDIVRDADTKAILDGGLRAAALRLLDIPIEQHSRVLTFTNDLHRLAYILAVHTIPGSKTRVPISLRDAILKEVLPRGEGILRTDGGRIMEPSAEDWLAITDKDFSDASTPRVVPEESAETIRDQILSVIDPGDGLSYEEFHDRLRGSIDEARWMSYHREIRDMAAEGIFWRRRVDRKAVFHRPGPSAKHPILPAPMQPIEASAQQVGMEILVQEAHIDSERWIDGAELDDMVTNRMGGKKKRSAYMLTAKKRSAMLHEIDGTLWRVESKKEGRRTCLRAIRV